MQLEKKTWETNEGTNLKCLPTLFGTFPHPKN